MKIMKYLAIAIVLLLPLTACMSTTPCCADSPQIEVVCNQCGEVQASEACCATDKSVCSKCGLHKGSPGCCKIEKGSGTVRLCIDCGKVVDEDCCKEKG